MTDTKHPFEDKYLDLKDENQALKRKKNEQEATIKRMYTKLAMLEETMKRKDKEQTPEADSPVKGGGGSFGGKRDVETEKFIDELRRENAVLRRKTQVLAENQRHIQEKEKHKAALHQSGPRKKSPRATLATKRASNNHAHGPASMASNHVTSTLERHSNTAREFHLTMKTKDVALEAALKARLITAERHVVKLQRENDDLKESLAIEGHHVHNNNAHHHGDDVEQLRRELRDRQAQLVILNARYDNLESKAMAEREIQEKTLEQMDNFNRVIHRLRSELQETQVARDESDKKVTKAKEMRHELEMLRDQNQKLEERMTSLCESPFINDAFQRKERIDKLVTLESQTKLQQTMIETLQADAQKQVTVIQELQANIRLLKQAKEAVEQELLRVKQLLDEERARVDHHRPMQRQPSMTIERPAPVQQRPPTPKKEGSHKATSPLRIAIPPPTQGEETQLSSFRPALPVVMRQTHDPSFVDFLDQPDDMTNRDQSAAYLRNKVHTLQIAHLTSTQELERCEKMLVAQTSINRELTFEIEDLVTRKEAAHVTLRKKLDELELVAEQRLRKIAQLEAQCRQLKYMRVKMGDKARRQGNDDELSLLDEGPDDGGEIDTSLGLDATVDLVAGENLLEIWVVGAQFDAKYINGNACTFVLCDFFDFESQSTSLAMGSHPAYNFAASYKITADAFFLRYLASESLALEVHQAIKGDFEVVGRTALRLDKLLHSRGALTDTSVPVRHVVTNAILGSLHVIIRLAIPLAEIWQLHLQSFPADRAFLQPTEASLALDDDAAFQLATHDQLAGPLNDLQVSILACRKLFTPSGVPPSAYVHYQLLGFPDVFTEIVPHSGSPTFSTDSGTHWFTLSVDPCLKQFFRKVHLRCTVFDDNQATHDDVDLSPLGPGVLGICDVPLKALVDGDAIDSWVAITNPPDESPVGELLVRLQWKNPFQVVCGPSSSLTSQMNALTLTNVHDLMTTFSLHADGRVNYRSFLLYAHASVVATVPFLEAVAAIQTSLHHLMATGDADGAREFKLTKTSYAKDELTKAFKQFGLVLGPDQIHVLVQVLGDLNGFVHTDELMCHIHPTPSCHDRFIAQKCRDTLRQFELRERQPSKVWAPFERYDPTQCHYVSRAEFKRGLSVLGFHMYDPAEEEAKQAFLAKTDAPSDKSAAAVADRSPSLHDDKGLDEELHPTSTSTLGKASTAKVKPSAATEFELRKAAFAKRIKLATDASHQTTFVLDKPTAPSTTAMGGGLPTTNNRAARLIQQRYRAYRSSGSMANPTPHHIVHVPTTSATTPMISTDHPATLLDVEAFLADTLGGDDLERARASLVRACQEMDPTKRGLVSRKQMTYILNPLCLKPTHLRCLLDAFRTDAKQIVFAPLLHFIFTAGSPTTPPLVKLLQSILLEDADVAAFIASDPTNGGILPYPVFAAHMKHCCGFLSAAQVHLIMQLFDVNGFGVEYRAFFHFVQSQPMAITLAKIKARLATLPSPTVHAIKTALASLGPSDSLSKLQVGILLKQTNVNVSPADQTVLWHYLDKPRLGTITPSTLWALFASPSSAVVVRQPSFDVLDLPLLQQLAWNSRRFIVPDPTTLLRAFTRYDWAKTGRVAVGAFTTVLQQAGFVFSPAHASQLARHFYTPTTHHDGGGGVQYGPFMQWSHGPVIAYAQLQTRLQRFVQTQASDRGMAIAGLVGQWLAAFPSPPVTRSSFAVVVTQSLHLPLNHEEIRVVLEQLDPHLTDTVDVVRFLHFENDDRANNALMPTTAAVDLSVVLAVLVSVVDKQPKQVVRMFETYDGGRTGKVEEDIFLLVWRKLGVELQPLEVRALFEEYAKDGRRLNYRKFLKHGLHVEVDGKYNDDDDEQRKAEAHRRLLVEYLDAVAAAEPEAYRAWVTQVKHHTKGRAYVMRAKAERILAKSLPHPELLDMAKVGLFLHVFESTEMGVAMAQLQSVLGKALPPAALVGATQAAGAVDSSSMDIGRSLQVLGVLLQTSLDRGVDYRRLFDAYDVQWQGLIPPSAIKAAIVQLGANMVNGGVECIGPLIGAFRDPSQKDLVNYIHLLHAARRQAGLPSIADPVWQLAESLRLRIRAKCQLPADVSDMSSIYDRLTPAFRHFDRANQGFLTLTTFRTGLLALHYDHASPAETQALFDAMAIFRTPDVVSRVEFDAFALDPHRADLVARLTTTLWAHASTFSQLSHALAGHDVAQSGVVSPAVVADTLHEFGIACSRDDLRRLQHLLDVNRTTPAMLSYKLLLRLVAHGRQEAATALQPNDATTQANDPSSSTVTAVHRTLQRQSRTDGQRAFEAADVDRRGALPVADFFLTMKHLGLAMTPAQVRDVVLRYPGDADQRAVDYRAVLADAFPTARSIVEVVATALQAAAARGVDVLARLQRLDTTGCGALTAAQFRQGLEELGVALTDDDVPRIMDVFGQADRGVELRHVLDRVRVQETKLLLRQLRPWGMASTDAAAATDTRAALEQQLAEHNVQLTTSQWQILCDQFEDASSGVQMGRLRQTVRAVAWQDAVRSLRQTMLAHGIEPNDIGQACLAHDEKRTGEISVGRFFDAIEAAGVPDLSTLERRMLQLTPCVQDGRVQYHEMLAHLV
ncbi:Aste57867_15131 [Aphanomyces stellatus]|uniref:Aste57867_15131 protein n=1 Tax=Aphanomyces stellatus TaxID=120398 RepID=A0A485L3Q2_9STRA|nr:hypothetical protein As57867_015075 [Aphanomyces stellatus]VFT91941.1 Aste57867_15131 [Aphanomyces stellatus]